MMRLARIVRDASDLDGSVRSLPTPCKNTQASSNASQIVRVLLKSNASGVSTMTPSPHARHASVRERTDAQKGPMMKWIGGPVALRRRLDHSEATPATVGSPSRSKDARVRSTALADALNARGISTPRGGRWYAKSVSNLLARS